MYINTYVYKFAYIYTYIYDIYIHIHAYFHSVNWPSSSILQRGAVYCGVLQCFSCVAVCS